MRGHKIIKEKSRKLKLNFQQRRGTSKKQITRIVQKKRKRTKGKILNEGHKDSESIVK